MKSFGQLYAFSAIAFLLPLHSHAQTYTLDGTCSGGKDLRAVMQEVQRMSAIAVNKINSGDAIAAQAFNLIFKTDNTDTASRATVRGLPPPLLPRFVKTKVLTRTQTSSTKSDPCAPAPSLKATYASTATTTTWIIRTPTHAGCPTPTSPTSPPTSKTPPSRSSANGTTTRST